MKAETRRERIVAASPTQGGAWWLRARARFAWRFLSARFSSSLTRRIVVLNLGGLVVLVVGFLLLNQFRADIIAARVQSLTTQADIISAAVAASAAIDTDTITIDPDKLLQLTPGQSVAPSPSEDDAIEFSINPERVGPVLHRLVTPTRTRHASSTGTVGFCWIRARSRRTVRWCGPSCPMRSTIAGSSIA